ncbi:MAG: CTP synthase [Alphaproteobacteria bacterium]|nr:CTP synthase [Alphaproteobacteria bacterium]
MTKYIFTLGGVVSSLGKGIASATLGALLQARGYKVRMRKMDPYLNLDPGTMSPYQHGEVFVTEDGAETDLDLGHYERFANISCHKTDSISGGRIYHNVLTKERRGDYLGGTVQMIPHVTNEVKAFLESDLTDEDFVLYEVGGTVGDIEGTIFLEAVRQFMNEKGRKNCCVVYLTLLPFIETAGELKTKPTQQAVKRLMEAGIQADVLLCRSKIALGEDERKKLALFCNVPSQNVVAALDVDNVYGLPISYHEQGLDTSVLSYFDMPSDVDLSKWKQIVNTMNHFQKNVQIAVVGKYCHLPDTYKSLKEALVHAGISENTKVDIDWIESDLLEGKSTKEVAKALEKYQGILVPGGFGNRGVEGKITAVQYARENKIPFFGICLGMQMAVVECMRHLCGVKDANSTEFTSDCTPVITRMSVWEKDGIKTIRPEKGDMGGTMRLGAYPCVLKKGSLAEKLYGTKQISERHRHRYEMDINYESVLAEKGVVISGKSPDGLLPEIIEIPEHPFFFAGQFHPEFKSKPFAAHPVFQGFIRAALKKASE